MGRELAIQTDRKFDGKSMRALPDRQRGFVLEMLKRNANPAMVMEAAEAAGYRPDYGYHLMRDEGVISALHEESVKRLTGAAIVGVSVLLEIAQSEDHKDRFKAAKELAAINGFTAEQRIRVEHVTEDKRDLIEQIKSMARELKLDPKQLLAGVGVVEGEFTEAPDE